MIYSMTLKKNRDILNDILKIEEQRELFNSLFDSFFTERFNRRFSLPLRYYMRCCLYPLKKLIESSNIVFHMFCCLRSYSFASECRQCSLLFVDWQASEFNLVKSIQDRYLKCYFNNGFTEEVSRLF